MRDESISMLGQSENLLPVINSNIKIKKKFVQSIEVNSNRHTIETELAKVNELCKGLQDNNSELKLKNE
jgi:hypothetical protein